MQTGAEPLPLHVRLLHDICMIALLSLVLVPGYLLLNQYWRSLLLLMALYGLLALLFVRLGWYVRRVMRRLPAEIPPWHRVVRPETLPPGQQASYGQGDMIRSVQKDPRYLKEVMKPRLRQLLAYRLSGSPDIPFEALDEAQLARVDPDLLEFLARGEAIGVWVTYRYRARRLQDVLAALQRVEAV